MKGFLFSGSLRHGCGGGQALVARATTDSRRRASTLLPQLSGMYVHDEQGPAASSCSAGHPSGGFNSPISADEAGIADCTQERGKEGHLLARARGTAAAAAGLSPSSRSPAISTADMPPQLAAVRCLSGAQPGPQTRTAPLLEGLCAVPLPTDAFAAALPVLHGPPSRPSRRLEVAAARSRAPSCRSELA